MGNTTWSDTAYSERAATRSMSNEPVFAYSERVKSGQVAKKVHPSLNPKGWTHRESRDGPNHPESNAIIIGLDVTGSMGAVVGEIHSKLPQLLGLLKEHNYLPHPQILFSAVGDDTSDHFPLQVGQFESGIEMEDNITNLIIEGGGGPGGRESYELLMYVGARKTSIDCLEKRRRKGYFFLFGDELPYEEISRATINALFGDAAQEAFTTERIVEELKEKYHVFFIIPARASGGKNQRVLDKWSALLGPDHVIKMPEEKEAAELIAVQIGICEGTAPNITERNSFGANLNLRGIALTESPGAEPLGIERV